MSRPEPRPTLLPQNRKLRHVRGIYLRNLSFMKPRGRAVDDATLQGRSPGKLEILRERGQLTHARSSESLPSLASGSKSAQKGRARSGTLTSLGAIERQKGLEASVAAKVADGFLTLHVDGEEDPVYISEVVDRSANFNFQFFDLSHLHSGITRASELTVRFWARRQLGGAWTLLLEDIVDLRMLSFVGSFENKLLPPNGLVFHLIDGVYSADVASRPRPPKNAATAPTSSYNALMKLDTLDSSIQDALETQYNLRSHINDILERISPNKVPQQRDKVELAIKAVATAKRTLNTAEAKKADLKESLAARREAMKDGQAVQDKAARDVANAQGKLASSKVAVSETKDKIRGQRRRICSELADIFKIEPVPDGTPLSFQICGLPLPNTTYDAATSRSISEDALSAALGYVAFLVNVLQYYLHVPLPYPITPLGSRSSVRDDISLLSTDPGGPGHAKTSAATRSRDFPLYLPRGGSTAAHFRFEYAWFLLNKDVEALCASQGLRVVDIRHTLPNVKYILYVCSAGAEEIPERKRGGVRGLWMGRMKGRVGEAAGNDAASSVSGSRRPSIDSTVVDSEVGSPVPTGFGLFGEGDTKMTLRTKGLREDVSK